jgi:hypothetical protein
MFESGERPVTLLECRVPASLGPCSVVARLHNPGNSPEAFLGAVGVAARLRLER